MNTTPGLTAEERQHFLEHGYVLLKGVFDRDFARAELVKVFASAGMDPDDPTTWQEPRISIPSTEIHSMSQVAPRLKAAVNDILGSDRYDNNDYFPNSMIAACYLGEGEPWAPPGVNAGWHKDGQFFRHFLDSPDQALLSIPLWSDVVPRGGGTFIAPESIPRIARFLADHPEGVHPNRFPFSDMMQHCPRRIEAVGEAGDVYLMHGYMLHSVSPNPDRKLRAIANHIHALRDPMKLNRADGNYSLLELATLNALGVDSYDFQPTRERVRDDDYGVLGLEYV